MAIPQFLKRTFGSRNANCEPVREDARPDCDFGCNRELDCAVAGNVSDIERKAAATHEVSDDLRLELGPRELPEGVSMESFIEFCTRLAFRMVSLPRTFSRFVLPLFIEAVAWTESSVCRAEEQRVCPFVR